MLLFQSDREFIVFTSAFIEIAVTLDVGRYNDSSSTLIIIYAVPYYCFSVIEYDSIHQTLRTTVCTKFTESIYKTWRAGVCLRNSSLSGCITILRAGSNQTPRRLRPPGCFTASEFGRKVADLSNNLTGPRGSL